MSTPVGSSRLTPLATGSSGLPHVVGALRPPEVDEVERRHVRVVEGVPDPDRVLRPERVAAGTGLRAGLHQHTEQLVLAGGEPRPLEIDADARATGVAFGDRLTRLLGAGIRVGASARVGSSCDQRKSGTTECTTGGCGRADEGTDTRSTSLTVLDAVIERRGALQPGLSCDGGKYSRNRVDARSR